MEKNKSTEFMVGVVVFIGLLILTFFVMKISDFRTAPSYNLRLVFGFVGGVGQSAPVRYAGVDAGEVKAIKTFLDKEEQKSKVEILVSIRKDLKIQEDAQAYIASLGLLGEKYVEILPGTAGARVLKENDVLIGHDPLAVEWMAQKGEEIITKLGRTIDSLNVFIADEENQDRFKQTMTNMAELTEKFNDLSTDLNAILGDNKENIGQTITNVSNISEKMDRTLDSINTILTDIEKGEGNLGKLLNDEKIYNDLEELVTDIKKHPWKLLFKTKDKGRAVKKQDKAKKTESGKEESNGETETRRQPRTGTRFP